MNRIFSFLAFTALQMVSLSTLAFSETAFAMECPNFSGTWEGECKIDDPLQPKAKSPEFIIDQKDCSGLTASKMPILLGWSGDLKQKNLIVNFADTFNKYHQYVEIQDGHLNYDLKVRLSWTGEQLQTLKGEFDFGVVRESDISGSDSYKFGEGGVMKMYFDDETLVFVRQGIRTLYIFSEGRTFINRRDSTRVICSFRRR